MDQDIQALNERIKEESKFVADILGEMDKVIVGQKNMVERLMIALLSDGHLLLEGVPGLAKTLAISTLSRIINARFQRIQFTPDLLPADLIGTLIYNQQEACFTTKKGPIFSNLILADEINRAPAKVQSALLEAMQERQVTISENTFKLDEPFLVLATQNPIEQHGTYPLPEAQIDRFMLKVVIGYPSKEEEKNILRLHSGNSAPTVETKVNPERILQARKVVREIYVDEKIENYILDIIFATRFPEKYGLDDLRDLINYGASPRASLYLKITACAHAFLRGRGYVTPEDVRAISMDVLRHRVIVSYEAEAEEVTSEDLVRRILGKIEVP
ncbi:MoxR family ATPase [bacterium]|nr:MoxR family ATPase [bacterium]